MLTKLLLPVACTGLALAACATAPQPLASAQEPAADCVAQTATRLPMKGSGCPGFGVRFTNQQLNSAGQPYAEQELRALQSSLTNAH